MKLNSLRAVRLDYRHEGWTGTPDESDFDSCWGLIARGDMTDARSAKTLPQAQAMMRADGKRFVIVQNPSALGCTLYTAPPSTPIRCVYAVADLQRRQRDNNRIRYQGNTDTRVAQLMMALRHKAKTEGKAFSITTADIAARFKLGICEVTGVKLDLKTIGRAPLSPAVDRKDPAKGYTKANVRITALAFNRLKCLYDEAGSMAFVEAMKKSAKSDTTIKKASKRA